MRMKVVFLDEVSKKTAEFGPYEWLAATEKELRVPVDLNMMDDEALEFREFCHSTLQSFEGLLATRQKGGSWELREMAGREAYEVYPSYTATEAE